MTGRLKLGDLEFGLKTATLSGALPDPYWSGRYAPGASLDLFWALDFQANPLEFEGHTAAPRLYHECFYLPVPSWTALAGQTVEWDSPEDEESGEPNGGLYVFSHKEIWEGALRIGERTGRTFAIEWTGRSDVGWTRELNKDVPFRLEATCTFEGIVADASIHDTAETVRARLGGVTALADLEAGPFTPRADAYDDGVGRAEMRFVPAATREPSSR
jgi:hypothetical protein